jgi:hypothetical protein
MEANFEAARKRPESLSFASYSLKPVWPVIGRADDHNTSRS